MSKFTYTKFGDKRIQPRKYEAGTKLHGPTGDLVINETCIVDIEQEYVQWLNQRGGYWRDVKDEAEIVVEYLRKLDADTVNDFLNVKGQEVASRWTRFWNWLLRKQPIPQARVLQ